MVILEIAINGRPLRWSAKVAFDRGRSDEALWGHVGFLQYFNAAFKRPGAARHSAATRDMSATDPEPLNRIYPSIGRLPRRHLSLGVLCQPSGPAWDPVSIRSRR